MEDTETTFLAALAAAPRPVCENTLAWALRSAQGDARKREVKRQQARQRKAGRKQSRAPRRGNR
jgi:hypothetical protein